MELRDKIRRVLRDKYGEFETILEHQYAEKLTLNLCSGTKREREEWATYNQVILEFKNSIKDMLKVKELQYKLTEVENPNDIIIEVIDRLIIIPPELERLYNKVKNF